MARVSLCKKFRWDSECKCKCRLTVTAVVDEDRPMPPIALIARAARL